MSSMIRKSMLAATLTGAAALSPLALSHFNDKEMNQSYRQSWFTLVAMNFGPLGSMAKGEMPWNDDMVKAFASDLEAVTSTNLMRGFAPGSERGTTRAKPEIWENQADFESKLDAMRKAVAELNNVADGGDKKAIAGQIGAVGKACKSCHDEYKSKDYLY